MNANIIVTNLDELIVSSEECSNLYWVANADYTTLLIWMVENNVQHKLTSFGPMGRTFTVLSNLEWFMMRWA